MKKSKSKVFNVFVCCAAIVGMLFLFTEYESYRFKPLPGPTSIVEPFNGLGVKIDAVAYSSNDSVRYLNRDINADGVRPVQITIQNNTPKSYKLTEKGFHMKKTSSSSVASKLIWDAMPRQIAYKAASFFFWPFAIPSTLDTLFTFRAHAKLKSDLKAKSVKAEEETILPYSTVHRVLFLPEEELADSFVIHLKDEQGIFRPFPVQLLKGN